MPPQTRKPRKPWFGPKRFGYGISPQTWQGWVVVVGVCAILFLIAHVHAG